MVTQHYFSRIFKAQKTQLTSNQRTPLSCQLARVVAHGLDMHKLVLITLFASCVGFVAASPMPSQAEIFATATTTSSGDEPTFTIAKRRRTFNCNQDDRLKKIEAQAWADAGAMAETANEYDSGNLWQPAMNYWMGADSTKSENFWKIRCKVSFVPFTNMDCRLYPTYTNDRVSRP